MAKFITKNATLLIANREVAGLSYQFDFNSAAPEEECTNYASPGGWREYQQGLRSGDVAVEVYQDVPDPEKEFFDRFLSGVSIPAGFTFTRPAVKGDLCWFLRCFANRHADKKTMGKLAGLSLTLKGDLALVRGKLLENAVALGTGTGAPLDLGVGVAATERLHWALWVPALAGTSPQLAAVLESDDAVGFTTPATRNSALVAGNNGGWFYGTVDGPVTDTWWRISRTLTGTGGPTATYFTAIGIAPIE